MNFQVFKYGCWTIQAVLLTVSIVLFVCGGLAFWALVDRFWFGTVLTYGLLRTTLAVLALFALWPLRMAVLAVDARLARYNSPIHSSRYQR
jgi:hypothetical protein